jgi:hypothetical protein
MAVGNFWRLAPSGRERGIMTMEDDVVDVQTEGDSEMSDDTELLAAKPKGGSSITDGTSNT